MRASISRCFVVPHTHWDREWYRPLEHFRLELARVVDGVIEALERDPRFRSFTLDGQAIVLEDYLDVRPENEGRLRALIEAGRLEVGPSYVLPDELLVGAEALVRNLLLGRTVCARFGAAPAPVGYMPDSFGHPAQLPQILAGFGIESFIFSRGLGDELDDAGVVFRWRAPDGSEVLAIQQLADYGNFALVADADDGERRVRGISDQFGAMLDRAGVHVLLLCNGSDHLPAQPELPDLLSELERRFDGITFTIAGYRDYVDAVGPVEVPSVSGELLGSRLQNVLRGVNSARLYLKRANERAERRLLSVETLAALRSLADGVPFPISDFRFAWRELLRCHPHDSICGCSCDEVHRDMLVRYELLERTVSLFIGRALGGGGVAADPGTVGVFNALPEHRHGLVSLPGYEPELVELDGFSGRTVQLSPVRAPAASPLGGGFGAEIESDLLRVEVAADGTLALLDKRSGRRFERLHALEDELDMGDLYNYCPVEGAPVWTSSGASSRVLADGPVVWELEVRVDASRPEGLGGDLRPASSVVPLSVSTVVRLVRGSARVEFLTTVANASRDHRLRAVFPVGTVSGPVRAEGQFAVVHRPLVPPQPKTTWVEPPDPTQHTLGAVALGPLALLTKGLPEYEARMNGSGSELCLTLLRCTGVISRPNGALATRPRGAGPQVPTPDGQCLGRSECEYALLCDADGLDEVALLRASQDYRYGLVTVPAGIELSSPIGLGSPIGPEGEVVFSCLKGAEDGDGLIMRCFNPASAPARARVLGPVSVSRTRLDETGEVPVPDGRFMVGAGEIATLRLRSVGDATARAALTKPRPGS